MGHQRLICHSFVETRLPLMRICTEKHVLYEGRVVVCNDVNTQSNEKRPLLESSLPG